MEETKEQSNEAIKKEVEGKAKQINSIDDQTAAINTENKIVDFDYVLNQNPALNFRINNLQKLGFGMDYIRRLVSIRSDFSVGDAESILEEEIEKVFNSLVRAISDDKNGIILNADGTIDEEASKIERAELATMHDISAQSYMLSKEKEQGIFLQISNDIKENEGKINIADYSLSTSGSILDELPLISNKDIEDYYNTRNLSNEYTESSKDEENVYIRDEEELNVLEAIYKFEKEMEENPTPERQAQMLAELKEIVRKNNSKFSDKLLGENGEFNAREVHNVRKEFEDIRNKTDVRRELEQYVHIIGFREFPKEDKEKIARILARAIKYKDDPIIQNLLEDISKNFRINVLSFSEIQKLIKETTGRDIEESELDEFNAETEFNLKNSDRKISLIREDLLENPDKSGMSAQEARAQSEQRDKQKRKYETLSARLSYMTITNEIEKAFSEGDKEAAFEFLSVYVHYNYSENLEDNKVKNLLKEYIKLNYDYLKAFFDDNYPELNVFHPTNKTLNVAKMRDELKNHKFSEEGQKRVENIIGKLKEYNQREQENYDEELVNEISSLTSENLTEDNENKLAKLLGRVDPYVLEDTLLKKLKTIKSDLISETVKQKFTEVYAKEGFPSDSYSKENVKLDFLNALEKNVVILERKLENAKGKPEYLDVLEECKKTYSENPYYEAIASKYRDSNGNLTDYANEKFEEYNDRIIKEAIGHNLKTKDEILELNHEEKERYISFLLVGLEINSLSIQGKCMKQLQALYTGAKDLQGEDFRNYIYQEIFGDEYSDKSLIDEQRKKLKENVLSQAINLKESIDTDKILDNEFKNVFNEKAVEMDATAIDFSKSEFQNLFNNSSVKVNERDEQIFQKLFDDTTRGSWISSKYDAAKQHFLLTYSFAVEAKNDISIKANQKALNKIMKKTLEENPGLKEEIFDENNEVKKELLDKNKHFREMALYSELLNKAKTILENPEEYENLNSKGKVNILEVGILIYKFSQNKSENSAYREMMEKLAVAILEKANSKDSTIVKLDKDGKPIVQENELRKKYSLVSPIAKNKNFSETYTYIFNKHSIYQMLATTKKYSVLEETDFVEVGKDIELSKLLDIKAEQKTKYTNTLLEIAKEKAITSNYSRIVSEVSKLRESDISKIENPYVLAIYFNKKIMETSEQNNENSEHLYNELFRQNTNGEMTIKETLAELRSKIKDTIEFGKHPDPQMINNVLGEGVFDNIIKMQKENLKAQVLGPDPSEKIVDEKATGLVGDIIAFSKDSIDNLNSLNVSAIWYYNAINEANRRGEKGLVQSLNTEFTNKFNGYSIAVAFEGVKSQISTIVDEEKNINPEDAKKQVLNEKIYNFINNNKDINKMCNTQESKHFTEELDKIMNKMNYEDKEGFITTLYRRYKLSENQGNIQIKGTNLIEKYILSRKAEFEDFILGNNTIDFQKLNKGRWEYRNGSLTNLGGKLMASTKSIAEKNKILKDKAEFVSTHMGQNKSPKESQKLYESVREILEKNEESIQNGDGNIIPNEMINELQKKESGNYFKALMRNTQKKQDTWKDYVNATLRLTGIALRQLPKVITGKESRSEFFEKIAAHATNGMERIGGKLKYNFGGLFSKNNRNKNEALSSGENLALPESNVHERESANIKENVNDKANKLSAQLDEERPEDTLKAEKSKEDKAKQNNFCPTVENQKGQLEANALHVTEDKRASENPKGKLAEESVVSSEEGR